MRSAFILLLVVAMAWWAEPAAQVQTKRPTQPPPRERGQTRAPTGQLHVSGTVAVSEEAPDFELSDAQGRPVKLSRFRGQWTLLVFAERMEAMTPLRDVYPGLAEKGVALVAVCADKPQAIRPYAEREKIPFDMLSDSTREITAMYGLRDPERAWILPGFLVLDPTGIVRMALLGKQLSATQISDLTRFAVGDY
jgi:peroxiredoxin